MTYEPGQGSRRAASAIRNVPRPRSTSDYGLPVKPRDEQIPFVAPAIEPIEPLNVAVVVGRCLMALGAALVGLAARRAADGSGSTGELWSVTAAAGVIVIVGLSAQVAWIAALAEAARRLRVRGASPRGQVIAWAIVVAWVGFACLTYLRIDVDGDLDPLPALALFGGACTLVAAYIGMRSVFAGLSRTPPPILLTVLPLDVAVLAVMWWRLLDLATGRDDLTLTSRLAFAATVLLLVNAVAYAWLAKRGSVALDERLRRLESQHRQTNDGDPPNSEWLERREPAPESPGAFGPPPG